MKYFLLIDGTNSWDLRYLIYLEQVSEAYYYDGEAVREVIIIAKEHVEWTFRERYAVESFTLDKDYVDETDRVFLVVIDSIVYVISRADVSKHLNALVSQLEIAQMAEAERV